MTYFFLLALFFTYYPVQSNVDIANLTNFQKNKSDFSVPHTIHVFKNATTTFSDTDQDFFVTVYDKISYWFSEFNIGTGKGPQINWLHMNKIPDEQTIFGIKFIDAKGFHYPLVEMYGATHMGNGNLYIYEIKNHEAIQLFTVRAYDTHSEYSHNEENFMKYGYFSCSEVFHDGKLSAQYEDFNNDNMTDIVLSGSIDVFCESSSHEVKMRSTPVTRYFMWNQEHYTFLETLNPSHSIKIL